MSWKVYYYTSRLLWRSAYVFRVLTFVEVIVLKQNVNVQSGVVVIVVVDQEHVVTSWWHDSRDLDSALSFIEWHDNDLFGVSNRERQFVASDRFSLK